MTAVLEVENKESLDKLLKMAKNAGIYAKQRKLNPVLTARKISEAEKRRIGAEAIVLLKEIQQASVEAGLDKMTLEEINEEIAEARKERAMREKCFA